MDEINKAKNEMDVAFGKTPFNANKRYILKR